MGRETSGWYNTQILVGMTDQRGKAWHYRAEDQGEEPNHYPGAIPVADVHRRLFSWQAEKRAVLVESPFGIETIPNRKAIVRDDTNEVLGIFTDNYNIHQYGEWLVKNLANIIDDDLVIGSAGLLKQGGVAWVSLEMPENIEPVAGFPIRPHLLATTSHNGQVATTYKQITTFVVCDNTYDVAMDEDGQKYSLRHSKYSQMRIQSARDALGIVHKMTGDIVGQIRRLADTKITEQQFTRVLNVLVPLDDNSPKLTVTRATAKRDQIMSLYRGDERSAAWNGTLLGALQAFNTYNHHFAGTDRTRVERNMWNAISGTTRASDSKVLATFARSGF